ncbi:GGDEF domain-containing protein [Erythrobacter mangrovi]|uniref:diguanylate cyclase n=1 Tax=Erythrobacter mangrovi TaxID=2739433 RepID=A0A7D3XRH9_9SPHN|nr:GGDEF domain-containing protein [Erythrobacter mangrovi]QKG71894.1 GGDEF domain-containing protein [Erythrobacter mangrovi]
MSASLLGIAILTVSIVSIPARGILGWFLAARVASFLFTRWSATRLEAKLDARRPLDRAEQVLFTSMAVAGATLGLLLWPAPPGAPLAAIATIHVAVMLVITLIAVTLAAFPGPRDAMLASFWIVTCTIVLAHPARFDPVFVLVSTVFVVGVRVYAANTGVHIVCAARTLVENRKLAEELAEALAHAEFLSWRDPLTGLFNRRRLFEERQARTNDAPRHLLAVDLDRFKSINDQFGHAVGDHVLIAAADAVREVLARRAETGEHQAYRLGGEEFLVIVEGVDTRIAEAMAEELRHAIAAIGGHLETQQPLSVTASIGLTQWCMDEELDDALLRSDMACYDAKRQGRNLVRCTA